MFKFLSILFLLFFIEGKGQSQLFPNNSIALKTIENKKVSLNLLEEAFVVVFLSPTCPLSQKYTLTLNQLAKEFHGKVKFYGVFAETDPVLEDYIHFRKKYNIQFELLVDNDKKLVKNLAASITPEAFVMNKSKLVYQGAIDDWVIELGKTKKQASVHFLRNALQSILANQTPAYSYIKPIGCFID